MGPQTCNKCGASLVGGSIWQHFYEEFQTEGYWLDVNGKYIDERRILNTEEAAAAADSVAKNYGATRTEGNWGLAIGIEYDRDRIEEWQCPFCQEIIWKRG